MADEEEGAPAEDQQGQLSPPSGGPAHSEPAEHRAEEAGEQQSDCGENDSQRGGLTQDYCLDQFKIRKFFVLRVKTSNVTE